MKVGTLSRRCKVLIPLVFVASVLVAFKDDLRAQTLREVYFSQGQAVYDPQNRSKTQQDAIRDFLGQAVVQAASSYLSPEQMGEHFGTIKENILNQPDRYVKSYKIFSENTEPGGTFKVVGQVSVSVELLGEKLKDLGLVSEETAEGGVSRDDSSGSGVTVFERSVSEKGTGRRDKAGFKVFWAVAEKWDQEWVLPAHGNDPNGLFAASVLTEAADYDWTLLFPPPGSLRLDYQGNAARGQVMAQAREAGAKKVVMGTVGLWQGRNQPARLDATLNVIDVASEKLKGEVRKGFEMLDLSNQEGAIELAAVSVPQLNDLFRESQGDVYPQGEMPKTSKPDEVVLEIRSKQDVNYWWELEKVLREKFHDIQIGSLIFGDEETTVTLFGIPEGEMNKFNGFVLSSGVEVRLSPMGQGGNGFVVSFVRRGSAP